MHRFLRYLSQQQTSPATRFGLPVVLVCLMTLLRLVAPLDVAPFLLYMPLVVFVTIAFGLGPGAVATILSELFAAYFFDRSGSGFSLGEWIALGQYLVVAMIMVVVCDALRRAIIDNEKTLRSLDGANRSLREREASLEAANATAEVLKAEAEAGRQAAEEANLAKSTFIANMSHELRTPLSAIIGYSEMMAEEIADGCESAELAADVAKVEGNARHLLGLINDVLDLSKVESGKMEVFAEDFAVTDMVRDIATTVESLVRKKGNRLKLDAGPGLGEAHTDVVKVRQVLLNLLSNASKFTEGGTITLAVSRGPARDGIEHLTFTVSDTGIGMTAEQLGKLFQRFTQADASTTRKFGGTGLGLSLTRAFADMLGGTVAAESEAGQGSRFTFAIPVRFVPPAEHAEELASVVDDVDHSERELVLVIDDDPDQRALMTRFLHKEGFAARTAADGDTGLQLARALKPRAILCDVMMPGIDGWSVLSALKADPELAAIPVVMITFMEQRALAASLGADDYVLKPVEWTRFKSVMDRYRPTGSAALVIDDDEDTRHRIRDMLERDGWSVAEAENGEVGLRRIGERQPDVVLLDLTMPVMDGFTFFERLRERPDGAQVPVVVLTALDLSRDDRRRLRGASQILNKGEISLRSLGERLHRAAESTMVQTRSD